MFWRGKHKFNHLEMVGGKKLIGFGALSAGLGSPQGNTYYVDSFATNAGDDNEGTDVDYPCDTLAGALDKCTADNDDYIIVLDCWADDGATIDFDVNRVHLIGLDTGNGKFPRLEATGNTSVIDIMADYFEIAGFSFGGGDSRGAIRWQASEARGIIHHCWFGHTMASGYGIEIPAGYDAMEMLIEDNLFGAALIIDGILINHNATRTIIRNNLFRRLGGLGVNVPAGKSFAEGSIIDNIFAVKDAQTGEAITIGSTAANAIIITGNRAMNGMLSSGYQYNPYRDLATNTVNDWGMNYRGNAVVEPVGA